MADKMEIILETYVQNEKMAECIRNGDYNFVIHETELGKGLSRLKMILSTPLKIGGTCE